MNNLDKVITQIKNRLENADFLVNEAEKQGVCISHICPPSKIKSIINQTDNIHYQELDKKAYSQFNHLKEYITKHQTWFN